MRKAALLVLAVLSVVLVTAGLFLLLQDRPPEIPNTVATTLPGGEVARISVQELSRQLENEDPPLVWEFVSAQQYRNGHVPGSRLMTFDELPAAAEGLQKFQSIVTLCT